MHDLTITCAATVAAQDSGIAPVSCLFAERQIPVRELIALAVREQCRQLEQRYATRLEEAHACLARQYLSTAEIAAQAESGRVALEVALPRNAQLDPDDEIRKALHGFQARTFLVMVGNRCCDTLDEIVPLGLNQPVQFIRMIPLVGG